MESPLSESHVSLRITEIQKKFAELMQDDYSDLCLEEPIAEDNSNDPYNRRR